MPKWLGNTIWFALILTWSIRPACGGLAAQKIPGTRLAAMDLDGIDAEVEYPRKTQPPKLAFY